MNNGFDTTWNPFIAQTWNRYLPPIRPSSAVVEIYARVLDEVMKQNKLLEVLILGATPEIRDLVLDRKLSSTVVDYSDVNYRTLSLLMKHIPIQESFVNQNWVTMNLEKQFDIIIGDHSLNVISYKSINTMLSNVGRHMKKHALLVVRTWVRPTKI